MLRLSLIGLLGLLLGVAPPAEHGMALSSPLEDPCPVAAWQVNPGLLLQHGAPGPAVRPPG